MPAVTPVDPSVLPMLIESNRAARPVQSIVDAPTAFEGAGFPVHRPFPQPGADQAATDPFLMLDEMGPIVYRPGEAVGAPDHPHRGFETVTYLFERDDRRFLTTDSCRAFPHRVRICPPTVGGLFPAPLPSRRRSGGPIVPLRGGAGSPRRASQVPDAEGRLSAPSPDQSEHRSHSVWQGSAAASRTVVYSFRKAEHRRPGCRARPAAGPQCRA